MGLPRYDVDGSGTFIYSPEGKVIFTDHLKAFITHRLEQLRPDLDKYDNCRDSDQYIAVRNQIFAFNEILEKIK